MENAMEKIEKKCFPSFRVALVKFLINKLYYPTDTKKTINVCRLNRIAISFKLRVKQTQVKWKKIFFNS